MLIPTRLTPSLSWVDVSGAGDPEAGPISLECGQREDGFCDPDYRISIDPEPSRITVDNQGYRYAYLPHLLFRRLTLLDSYHCSRYNTQTRRLTPEMFERVFARARGLVDGMRAA